MTKIDIIGLISVTNIDAIWLIFETKIDVIWLIFVTNLDVIWLIFVTKLDVIWLIIATKTDIISQCLVTNREFISNLLSKYQRSSKLIEVSDKVCSRRKCSLFETLLNVPRVDCKLLPKSLFCVQTGWMAECQLAVMFWEQLLVEFLPVYLCITLILRGKCGLNFPPKEATFC